MALWLNYSQSGFEAQFAAFLTTKREVSEDVQAIVRMIIDDVRARGDVALADYSLKFDGLDFDTLAMRVTNADIDASNARAPPDYPLWNWPPPAFQNTMPGNCQKMIFMKMISA